MIRRVLRRALEALAFGLLWIAELLEGNSMDETAIEITKRDVNGKGIEAKVFASSGAIIVAQKIGFADWEALYAESKGSKIDLPSCFSLNGDTVKAIEAAAERNDE